MFDFQKIRNNIKYNLNVFPLIERNNILSNDINCNYTIRNPKFNWLDLNTVHKRRKSQDI